MGRNGGHPWGETVAAYGELSMAAVTGAAKTVIDRLTAVTMIR
jgi:hypothetical protein